MSIPSTHVWGTGEKVTSAQLNQFDTYLQSVVDKRSGQTDTLQSVVACSGAGRITLSQTAGADADTTYALSSGISIIDASTNLTAARAYTLSNTGASPGDIVRVFGNPTYDVTVKDASSNPLLVVGTSPSGAAQSAYAEFKYNGTAWKLFEHAHIPPGATTTWTAPKGSRGSSRKSLTTTSASTVSLDTLTLADDTTATFAVRVTCTRQTLNTKRGSWTYAGQVARSSGGIAILDNLTPGLAVNINSAGSVTVDVDGANTLRVRVTPSDTDGRNWQSELDFQIVTDAA